MGEWGHIYTEGIFDGLWAFCVAVPLVLLYSYAQGKYQVREATHTEGAAIPYPPPQQHWQHL